MKEMAADGELNPGIPGREASDMQLCCHATTTTDFAIVKHRRPGNYLSIVQMKSCNKSSEQLSD